MALTPDGKSLLIGDTVGNTIFFLNPATGDVQRQLMVSDPYQLTFSPDGKWHRSDMPWLAAVIAAGGILGPAVTCLSAATRRE